MIFQFVLFGLILIFQDVCYWKFEEFSKVLSMKAAMI